MDLSNALLDHADVTELCCPIRPLNGCEVLGRHRDHTNGMVTEVWTHDMRAWMASQPLFTYVQCRWTVPLDV
jgi:hypothetical protein